MSELTRYDFQRVFQMSAMEFFTFIAYLNFDRRREERRIKNMMKKNG